ncbi:MAG: Asp-tRNA(Asn)/Glu-tRNA(Gln) amidotransferase subunit GatC [Anaerolineaceae bacterium]|nr:Asp-tRNA(Asn)/Glu-tRNA(Gln) amidotransferase subunit GatC [Anaerolineaceae bacterium]
MSISRINPELFHKLVGLAALELTEDEGAYLLTEMNNQLSSVNALLQVPLDEDIQPTLHGIQCQGAGPRADLWQPFPTPGEILAGAPETEDGMFAVPDVKGAK